METESVLKLDYDTEKMKDFVVKSLEDDKAENIVIIDLAGKTEMARYMVIATGRSSRHAASIADNLVDRLKDQGIGGIIPEGKTQSDWLLVDLDDIIVHVFREEIREIYRLEKMWRV